MEKLGLHEPETGLASWGPLSLRLHGKLHYCEVWKQMRSTIHFLCKGVAFRVPSVHVCLLLLQPPTLQRLNLLWMLKKINKLGSDFPHPLPLGVNIPVSLHMWKCKLVDSVWLSLLSPFQYSLYCCFSFCLFVDVLQFHWSMIDIIKLSLLFVPPHPGKLKICYLLLLLLVYILYKSLHLILMKFAICTLYIWIISLTMFLRFINVVAWY